jgi:glucan endo-1,3-beta-D-glucosidase
MRFAAVTALAASVSGAVAETYLGFNSGATTDAGTIKKQADFEKEFSAAQSLKGAPGTFSSVRLYTNIQGSTTDSPIEAFPAAIKTKTKILLGMWVSGTTNIDNELSALSKAIDTYGKDFTDLVIGISVGSEDLYRISVDGIKNKVDVGQSPSTVIDFIKDTRDKLKGTALSKTPVGHVDTWTAWANSSNKAVVDAVDFVGVNSFPYYENGDNIHTTNSIENAADIFADSLDRTKAVIGDKPMWITETGWPTTGPKQLAAVPSVDNAEKYWQDVGCPLFGSTNTFWYILRDSNPENKMKFGINKELDGNAAFNLTCPTETKTKTSSASGTKTASPSGTGSSGYGSSSPSGVAASPTGTGSSGSGESNNSVPTSPTPTPEGSSDASMPKLNALVLGVSMIFGFAALML